jgi:hypothetical protein
MPQPITGRQPLSQIPCTISQEQLATVHFDQPLTRRRGRPRHQTQEVADPLIDLIVGNSIPIHILEHTFDEGQIQEGCRQKHKKFSEPG